MYTEDTYENSILELFQNLGYTHYVGYDIERDYKNPLFLEDLDNLYLINNGTDRSAIDNAVQMIQDIDSGSLEERNDKFMDYLQNGISVSYWKDNEELSTLVKLVDFENIDKNLFTVINQWTFEEKEVKRPDIIVFINGLPLVVIELKSPSREDADTSEAYNQLQKYMKVIPSATDAESIWMFWNRVVQIETITSGMSMMGRVAGMMKRFRSKRFIMKQKP